MSDARADSPALGRAGPKPPGEGWPLNRWLILIALVCAAHVALLYAFGARNQIVPRAAADPPTLKLVGSPNEFLSLNDPTLFALPHSGDFVTEMGSRAPFTSLLSRPPELRSPRWLPLPADDLMTAFNRFTQTNQVTGFALQLKTPVKIGTPTSPMEPAFAQVSMLRIKGDLAQRRLLTSTNLPSLAYADVIAPSKVQVLVNEAGSVVSAILLPSNDSLEALSQYPEAGRRALELARAARFTPAPRLTIGRMIFTWHTVPPPATSNPTTANEPNP